jgi:aspartyl-tRNA(Asn)/glutamyl-tRNA(Gln) amidotransferase subunit C
VSDLTRDDVSHVAALARLRLDDAALDHFTEHLSSVLDYAAEIEALDLSDVEPMTHPMQLRNVLRPDIIGDQIDRADLLSQAPDHDGERFRVPPILGDA